MKKVFSNQLLNSLSLIQEETVDPEFRQYLQAFLSSAILGVIQEWLDSGNEDVEEMAIIHFRLIRFFGNLAALQVNVNDL
ncbi:TetR-like C-terminal domain-containing protein [Lysinibacillus pakistanensis]|uniref:TetR-like C-terminal domain-containing protein n=2 Tax=Bacillaceae TaxID=186817 RepID=UPI003D28CD57